MRGKVGAKGKICVMFSIKVSKHQRNQMLNMCDADILDSNIVQGDLTMHISKSYYGGEMVDAAKASDLLKNSSIINMVGKNTVSLSIQLGIGSKDGVKKISGVPFLIVFKT
ncbi:MAG: DUF424 domain-containing protein [Nitrosopumilus sp. D6]|nr:MAG: DUF424 domain-containing protein [Nitrosopumilus sp. D6]